MLYKRAATERSFPPQCYLIHRLVEDVLGVSCPTANNLVRRFESLSLLEEISQGT